MKQMKRRTFNCLLSFLIIVGIGVYFFYVDNYKKNIRLNDKNIKISLNNTEATKENIELKVRYVGDINHIKSYSFDEGKIWSLKNTYEVTNNGNINIWVKDINNKIYKTTYEVTNIDKEGPEILFDDNIKVPRYSKINLNDFVTINDYGVGIRDEIVFTPEVLNTANLGEQKIYIYAIDKLANKTIKQITFEIVPQTDYILARNIDLNKSNIILKQGEKTTIKATLTPKYSSNKTIKYTSSDVNVVRVDQVGNIVGLTSGQATITASTTNGLEARVIVLVK